MTAIKKLLTQLIQHLNCKSLFVSLLSSVKRILMIFKKYTGVEK